ncbi:MAG: ParA family protein [Candidatus Omnitrophica bacterium]|nr:ParA family protein [Candidatus Omnitrophota bacterium]
MRRIVVANQKGGVAKTTTSLNLAAELSRAGKKVLLIDMDPQHSATSAIFGNANFEYTIYNVLVERMDIKDVVQYSENFGIDVVPSDIGLSGASMRISEQIGREKVLYHYTRELPNYDFVIIDAPPSLGLLTINALTACEELLVPICPDFFSLKGIKLLEEVVSNVKVGLESQIELLGVVITRYRERVVTGEAKNAIQTYFGQWVFDAIIPENITLEEAHNAHLPVYKYDKSSKGAIAYANLAKEVINGKSKGRKKPAAKKKLNKRKTNR